MQVHSVAFSPREELLWAGAESGALYAMALPPLRTYSSVRAHALPLADLAPLSDGVASVSANALRYHASGGRELAALVDLPVRPGQLRGLRQGWWGPKGLLHTTCTLRRVPGCGPHVVV